MPMVKCRVTAPQLTLLETVMRRMDRVDAWICNNGGGHALNVFNVILLPSLLLQRKLLSALSTASEIL